jgi:hypothetical protein
MFKEEVPKLRAIALEHNLDCKWRTD